jgi:hypothetical protein
MRDGELLQTQHALSSTGELVGGGAAHRAHAEDDHVVSAGVVDPRHHDLPSPWCPTGTVTRELIAGTGEGWGCRSWSSCGLDRMRAISGSKKGVWTTFAGTGLPFTSTSTLALGQACAVST